MCLNWMYNTLYMLKVSLNSFLTNQAIIYIGFSSEFRSTENNLETGELARFCSFCGCYRDIFVIFEVVAD